MQKALQGPLNRLSCRLVSTSMAEKKLGRGLLKTDIFVPKNLFNERNIAERCISGDNHVAFSDSHLL